MIYTIDKIKHVPGDVTHKQGISKKNYTNFKNHNHIIGGSNGSFVTISNSQTTIYTTDENNNKYSSDIYIMLKRITGGKRFSKKFISELNEKLNNKKISVEKAESFDAKLEELIIEIL